MTTTIGSTIFIATGAPATNNKAGFDALTWVEIEDVTSLGSFNVEQNTAENTPVKTGFTQSVKTSTKGVAAPLAFIGDGTATGQAAVKAACAASTQFSIKVIEATGTNYKAASGIFYSYTDNEISADMELGATCTFLANALPIDASVA
jgi:hypothetical protein